MKCQRCEKKFNCPFWCNELAEGRLKLKIHKGKPTKEDYLEIQKMINEGYHTGIDRPYGINWELKRKDKIPMLKKVI